MAKKTAPTPESEAATPAADASARYTKAQIVASKKYRAYRDVLAVALKDGAFYTAEEIQAKLEAFLKRPVQNQTNGKGN